MKTSNMSLPNLFKAKENVHTDEIKLEIPEINAVEIKEIQVPTHLYTLYPEK